MFQNIPVVDFSAYGLGVSDISSVDKNSLNDLSIAVNKAFRNIGFCYLKNHGVPEELIQKVQQTSKQFFDKDIKIKLKFAQQDNSQNGWTALERESLNPERPGDLKESYNFVPYQDTGNWPDVPDFKDSFQSLFAKCTSLSLRIFDVISQDLNLNDEDFLRKSHSLIGKKGNLSALRSLLYPELPSDGEIKAGQVRCGEHSDYGTITLLFQDNIGGLEVRKRDGEYIPATPIPGTVLVNLGDMMQRWSSDMLIASKHRILIPEEEIKKRQRRQSIVFFVNPDDEAIINCLDGSSMYEPISSKDYLHQKFSVTS